METPLNRISIGKSSPDSLNQNALRIQYKNYYLQCKKLRRKLMDSGLLEYETFEYMPSFPNELHYLRCGAKTRAGTPCKMKSIYSNTRCKLHGGLSTGAKTKEGKAKVAMNGLSIKKVKQTP